MSYTVKVTESFVSNVKKYKKNSEPLLELDKKIKRLQDNPFEVGKRLCGKPHGYYSTRLDKNFRLIFSINENSNSVFLEALDHRKDVYKS